MMNYTACVEV